MRELHEEETIGYREIKAHKLNLTGSQFNQMLLSQSEIWRKSMTEEYNEICE